MWPIINKPNYLLIHNTMKKLFIIAIAALFMVMGLSSCGYNTMVSKEEAVSSAVGNLQTAYQKRADLIPNLVATVKSYAEYEAGTLTAVVEARAKLLKCSTNIKEAKVSKINFKIFFILTPPLNASGARKFRFQARYKQLK